MNIKPPQSPFKKGGSLWINGVRVVGFFYSPLFKGGPGGFLALLFSLFICQSAIASSDPLHQYRFYAFGTEVSIVINHPDEKQADQAFSRIKSAFDQLNYELNPWKTGPLNTLNKSLASTGKGEATSAIIELCLLGQQYSRLSDGLFDPAIGKLIKSWQFDDASNTPEQPSLQTLDEITQTHPGMHQLIIDPPFISTKNRQIQLDFGGMAKGYAVDIAIGILKEEGISSAIVNAGGDLKAMGQKQGKPWLIGIRHPRDSSAIAGVQTQDGDAVFTSGDYERFFDKDGKRKHHILDPTTGAPASQTVSVTVIHSDAALADAAATALFVAGPERWYLIANRMGVDRVMLIDDKLNIRITEKMARQTEILDSSAKISILDTQAQTKSR